jgi:large subunit ribosomal protein L22
MEFRAEAKYIRVSPQKARLVLDLIKGRRVEDALNTLTFTKKGIAPDIEKLLRSAIQNATYVSQEKGLDVDVDNLFVKNAISNEGPRRKRIRPAPMGRAYRYQRRMAHLSIVLAERSANGVGTTVDSDTETAPAARSASANKKSPAKKAAGKKTAAKKTAARK